MRQHKLTKILVHGIIAVLASSQIVATPLKNRPKTYKKKKSDPEETVQENSDRTQTTSAVSIETGTRLAIFEFEGKGISVPLAARMTEEFRNTVRRLNIFEVQDRGLTQRINIFRPETDDYWDCWNKDCAVERGKLLGVNYVIAGTIEDSDENKYLIKGRLYSVDLESLMNDFSFNSTGITDSLLLGMKKLAYDVSGLPIPDTLSIGADTTKIADLAVEKEKFRFRLPDIDIPDKIKSLLLSTVVPGTGQMYSKRKYVGMGFLATEITLAGFAFIWQSDYKQSWGGFQNTYNSYQNLTDPKELLELRPDIIRYARETKRYNDLMRNVRILGLGIWVVNMIHAYIVGPEELYEGNILFGTEYDDGSQSGSGPGMTAWDLASGFGVRGMVLRPFVNNTALEDYRNHTSGGFKIKTPVGFTLGPIRTFLQYEISNYTFDQKNYDNENVISGFNRATIMNIDYSNLLRIGGESVEKSILFGLTRSGDGNGFMTGMDIAFKIDATVPLYISFFGRTNSIKNPVHGDMFWITAGANLGVDIP